MFRDLAAAPRFWIRRPLVALASVLSLGVGLAVATVVFAVADAAIWRPLPLPAPERVVWVDSLDGGDAGGTSPGVFTVWATRGRGFEALAAVRPSAAVFRDRGPGVRLDGAYASAAVIDVLGLAPALGRAISREDDRPGAPPVLVIGHRFWQQQYGGAADVLGRAVTLAGQTRTIVGVMRREIDELGFGFDWWAPLALSAAQATNVGPRYLSVVGRLGDVSSTSLERDLAALAAAAGARGDTGAALDVRVEPLKARFSADLRRILLPLLAAVMAVVLLASLNAASLLLAQGQSRRGELAVRASLGASRGRLVRQLLFESCWLTAASGAVSLLMSMWLIEASRGFVASAGFTIADVRLDSRTTTFTLLLVAAVTMLSGVLPALRNSSTDLRGSLSSGGRTVISVPDRLRRALVVAQVGLAITIAAAGALMLRTTQELSSAPRGYDRNDVLTAAVQLPSNDYPSSAAMKAAIGRVLASVVSLPGVTGAAMSTRVPLSGGAPGSDLALWSEAFAPGSDRQVRVRFVTPGYFAAVGTPLLAGRDVATSDAEASAPVVLVNQTLARRLTGGAPLVGRDVKFAVKDFDIRGPQTAWSVVGIVADARDSGPRVAVQPEVYLPMAQGPAGVFDWIGRQVLVAVRSDPARSVDAAALRAAVAGAEPGLALYDVLTLGERFREHVATERLLAGVLVPLGATSFALSAFGIFTLLMQLVVGRRRELAIRMALGATSQRVVRSLVGEGFALTAWGMVLGLIGAAVVSQAVRPLMFGVSPADPNALAALIVMTALTTLLATWIPARRAVSVDPAAVLRAE